jgi:hypothetical protein
LTTRLIALLAAVTTIALLVAGCGSSDDSTTDAADNGETLTKAEFVKQANAICAGGNKEIENGFEELAEEEGISEKKPPSEEFQEEAIESVVIPGVQSQLDEIRALGFPDDEAEAIVESAEEDLEEAEEDPKTLGETDGFKETNKEARAYGLTVCGKE